MKEPKLIVLNGLPGIGKTTIAQHYIDEHPMALALDIDKIWWMMGQWQQTMPQSGLQKMKLAYAMAELHLRDGYDVVVAQHLREVGQYEQFELIAQNSGALIYEVLLYAPFAEALARFKKRGRALGHKTGFRPGGILDASGRELKLREMYDEMMLSTSARPATIRLRSHQDAIEDTYKYLLRIIL